MRKCECDFIESMWYTTQEKVVWRVYSMVLSSSEEGLLRWIEASQTVPSLLLVFAFAAVFPRHDQYFIRSRSDRRSLYMYMATRVSILDGRM